MTSEVYDNLLLATDENMYEHEVVTECANEHEVSSFIKRLEYTGKIHHSYNPKRIDSWRRRNSTAHDSSFKSKSPKNLWRLLDCCIGCLIICLILTLVFTIFLSRAISQHNTTSILSIPMVTDATKVTTATTVITTSTSASGDGEMTTVMESSTTMSAPYSMYNSLFRTAYNTVYTQF